MMNVLMGSVYGDKQHRIAWFAECSIDALTSPVFITAIDGNIALDAYEMRLVDAYDIF